MPTYTVHVDETEVDLDALSGNHYNLQVAKAVASEKGGAPTYNIVYKSASLTPTVDVAWTVQYGLNYVVQIPTPGAIVTGGGNWQPCNFGESYDLTSDGEWVPNNTPGAGVDGCLSVGNNGRGAVNIVVGVQDPVTRVWAPIWVAQDSLMKNGSGTYEPRESVELWFQQSDLTATMIDGQQTALLEYDLTTTPERFFSYDTKAGKWLNAPTPFPTSKRLNGRK